MVAGNIVAKWGGTFTLPMFGAPYTIPHPINGWELLQQNPPVQSDVAIYASALGMTNTNNDALAGFILSTPKSTSYETNTFGDVSGSYCVDSSDKICLAGSVFALVWIGADSSQTPVAPPAYNACTRLFCAVETGFNPSASGSFSIPTTRVFDITSIPWIPSYNTATTSLGPPSLYLNSTGKLCVLCALQPADAYGGPQQALTFDTSTNTFVLETDFFDKTYQIYAGSSGRLSFGPAPASSIQWTYTALGAAADTSYDTVLVCGDGSSYYVTLDDSSVWPSFNLGAGNYRVFSFAGDEYPSHRFYLIDSHTMFILSSDCETYYIVSIQPQDSTASAVGSAGLSITADGFLSAILTSTIHFGETSLGVLYSPSPPPPPPPPTPTYSVPGRTIRLKLPNYCCSPNAAGIR